ncbi:unnamed protein product [Amoebophrya sp. A120]|nr:unnamed protein product [Amoebophrya sp. A120]|eukprot:GSA120T00025031001.1
MTRSYSDLFRLPDSYMGYDILRLHGESLDALGCCKSGTGVQYGTMDFLKMVASLDRTAMNLTVTDQFTDRDWKLSCAQVDSNASHLTDIRYADLFAKGSQFASATQVLGERTGAVVDETARSSTMSQVPGGVETNTKSSSSTSRPKSVGLALHLCQLAAIFADRVLSGHTKDSQEQRVASEWIVSQALLAFQALCANLRTCSWELLDEVCAVCILPSSRSRGGGPGPSSCNSCPINCALLLAKFCDQHLYFRLAFQALVARKQQDPRQLLPPVLDLFGEDEVFLAMQPAGADEHQGTSGATAQMNSDIVVASGGEINTTTNPSPQLVPAHDQQPRRQTPLALSTEELVVHTLTSQMLRALAQQKTTLAKNSLTPLLRSYLKIIATTGTGGVILLRAAAQAVGTRGPAVQPDTIAETMAELLLRCVPDDADHEWCAELERILNGAYNR